MSASKWDKLGQRLDRIRDPLGWRLWAHTHPWKVHPDLLKEEQDEKNEPKKSEDKK